MPAQQFTPEAASAALRAEGRNGEARLIEAMIEELAAVRAEREVLASFVRSVSFLTGSSPVHGSGLAVRAMKALDALRVTERCPKRDNGRHRWMRGNEVFGSRCFSCNARRPGT